MRDNATESRLPEGRNGRRVSPPPGLNGHANGAAPRPEVLPEMPPRNGAQSHPGAVPAPPLSPSADGEPAPGKDPATGRFLPGNKLGRGNPHYRKLAENRTAFLQAVGPNKIRQVVARLLERALNGNLDAARLLLAYAVGRPAEAADPDRADLDEFRLLCEFPKLMDAEGACARVAPALAVVQAGEKLAADPEGYIRLLKMRKAELLQEILSKPGGREALYLDPDLTAALAALDPDEGADG